MPCRDGSFYENFILNFSEEIFRKTLRNIIVDARSHGENGFAALKFRPETDLKVILLRTVEIIRQET